MTEKEPAGAADDAPAEGTEEEATAEQTAVTQAVSAAADADGETAVTAGRRPSKRRRPATPRPSSTACAGASTPC